MIRQADIMLGLDHLAARSVAAMEGYRAQVISPLVAVIKAETSKAESRKQTDRAALRELHGSLGAGLLKRMGTDALGEAMFATLMIAAGVGLASGNVKTSTRQNANTETQKRGNAHAGWKPVAHAEPARVPVGDDVALLTREDFRLRTASEAAEFVRRKAALTDDQFERLSKINRARAFKLAGAHNAGLVQRARDIVADAIEKGRPLRDVRSALDELFDAEGLPRMARHRLNAMFRQQTFTAYSVARKRTLDERSSTLTHREYSVIKPGDPSVRETHQALHGVITRWNDPFWDRFTPPWEFNCRCLFFGLRASTVRRMGATVYTYSGGTLSPVNDDADAEPIAAQPNPEFDYPRDVFDARTFDLAKLDAELREVLEAGN